MPYFTFAYEPKITKTQRAIVHHPSTVEAQAQCQELADILRRTIHIFTVEPYAHADPQDPPKGPPPKLRDPYSAIDPDGA